MAQLQISVPAAIFEGLRSQDINIRLDSFTKIKFVAEHVGPERTRNDLLPYFGEFCDDDDVILIELLNQLSSFTPYVGGAQHVHSMYDLLETLMLHDSATVRLRACDVFISLLAMLNYAQILTYVLPVLRHLVVSEWYVGRLSVAIILPHVYQLLPIAQLAQAPDVPPPQTTTPAATTTTPPQPVAVPATTAPAPTAKTKQAPPPLSPAERALITLTRCKALQLELLSIFSALTVDEHPAVRKLSYQQFGLFASLALSDVKLARMLYHLAIHGSKDPHDTIRVVVVDAAIILLDVLRHYGLQHRGIAIVSTLITDTSWKVRYIMARRFPLLLSTLADSLSQMGETAGGGGGGDENTASNNTGAAAQQLIHTNQNHNNMLMKLKPQSTPMTTLDSIIAHFCCCLTDPEAEVRTAAASVVGRVSCLIGSQKTIQYIIPLLRHCADDTNDNVRIALSKEFLLLCNILPQYVIHDVILILLQQFLLDLRSEVKLNIIHNISLLKPHINSVAIISAILPAIIDLSQHNQWRTRLNITSQYVILAKQMQPDFFVERLLPLALSQLCDSIASVRSSALANCYKFTVVYGVEWCQKHILPRLRALARHASFQHRSSAAIALQGLISILPLNIILRDVYPMIDALLQDRVTNVQTFAFKSVVLILLRLIGPSSSSHLSYQQAHPEKFSTGQQPLPPPPPSTTGTFNPQQHVWLQNDKLFNFIDDQTTLLTATETTYQGAGANQLTSITNGMALNDLQLLIQILTQNVKNMIFWDQTVQLIPSYLNTLTTTDPPQPKKERKETPVGSPVETIDEDSAAENGEQQPKPLPPHIMLTSNIKHSLPIDTTILPTPQYTRQERELNTIVYSLDSTPDARKSRAPHHPKAKRATGQACLFSSKQQQQQ